MKLRILYIVIVILLLGMAVKIGVQVGSKAEREKLDKVYLSSYGGLTATEAIVHVRLLEHLRSGSNDKAEEMLENMLDNDLSGLAVHLSEPQGLSDEMKDAVIRAKEYREKYPTHKVSSNLANSVQRVLDSVK